MKNAIVACAIILIAVQSAFAGPKTKALREAIEYVMSKFGREATKELGKDATETVARRMETLAATYGEEQVINATKKVGPRIFRLVEEVGEDGAPRALKLMAKQGDEAVWVVSRPKSFALFVKYGDDAANAMIRHREIAESLIENYGTSMSKALSGINGQNGRRLAMLANEGTLSKIPQRDAVLDVVGRYGDGAADFVWRNKGALASTAAVTAFLADPEPFISGTRDFAQIVGDVAKEPLREVARATNWTIVIVSVIVILATLAIIRWRRFLFRPVVAGSSSHSVAPPTDLAHYNERGRRA